MKHSVSFIIRVVLLAFLFLIFWWAITASLTRAINVIIIVGGVLLTYPLVWTGRKILDRGHTKEYAEWVTTFVHAGLGFTFGVPLIRALSSYRSWNDWILPVPEVIGLVLVILTGAISVITVATLALRGWGAPFFISLSRRLAADWMYAWTRNPMVLAALALLVSLGIWFQSTLFILWVLLLFTPAILFFVKVYEERELEFRFGQSYLDYKARTPMLFPKKPKPETLNRGPL